MMSTSKEWFRTWFDSPYYHLLYQNRDHDEAKAFIDSILSHLQLDTPSSILDLACGRGRHSEYLSLKGHQVTGVDLSVNNIKYAKENSKSKVHFDVHDMREVYRQNAYNLILNLFTSFGYFDDDKENIDTLKAMREDLTEDGIIVLDFLNGKKAVNNLPSAEEIERSGISFLINRKLVGKWITKEIQFTDQGTAYDFEEKVRYIELSDFQKYLLEADLKIKDIFGSYELLPFDESSSERLIFFLSR
ncbi:MAG: methyltransferase domain-containing protein [Bacteroidetes bacterium]|nr:methyltransferase domain-containing protein [Bacteroidota bacterium]